jgi:hypothetical protein
MENTPKISIFAYALVAEMVSNELPNRLSCSGLQQKR